MARVLEKPASEAAAIERPAIAELLARVEALSSLLRERAPEAEAARRVSTDTIERVRASGVFRLMQPAAFGGYEYGFNEFIEVNRITGRACASSSWCVSLGIIHQWFVALFPREAQEEVWTDPGNVVAVSYAPAGTARAAAGGYKLSGKWSWLSNCDNSAWYMIATLLPPATDGGRPEAAFVLVPASECRIIDDWFSVGLQGTGSKSIEIVGETFVPKHRVLTVAQAASGRAPGTAINSNPHYRIPFLACVPLCLATPGLGAAEGALEEFITMASGRTTRGAVAGGGNKMAEFAQVQARIGEAAAALDAAYLVVSRDAREAAERAARDEPIDIAMRIRNRRGHAYCAKLAAQAATGLFEAVGGGGLTLSSPIQRAWRDTNAIARHISLNWDGVGTMYGQHRLGLEPRGQY